MFSKSRLNTAAMMMAIAAGMGAATTPGRFHSGRVSRHISPKHIQEQIQSEAMAKRWRKSLKRKMDCYSRGDLPLKIKVVAQ